MFFERTSCRSKCSPPIRYPIYSGKFFTALEIHHFLAESSILNVFPFAWHVSISGILEAGRERCLRNVCLCTCIHILCTLLFMLSVLIAKFIGGMLEEMVTALMDEMDYTYKTDEFANVRRGK